MKSHKSKKMRKPPALKLGDTIALVRPAGFISDKILKKTAENLRSLGFCVVTYLGKSKKDGFFSASDESRAAELNWAFSQPGISAIFCCRGGYGSVRTFSHISKTQIQKWKPKIFVGYSDMTYVHQILQNEMGLVSFHGPLSGFLNKKDLKVFVQSLLDLPRAQKQKWSEVKIYKKGSARGKLLGGNLSLLQVAGRAALPKVPMILAIEDVNENFYRIDRMIWTLIDAGYAPFVRGVVLGKFLSCGKDDSKIFGWSRVMQSLQKLTRGPIWQNANFGHGMKRQRLLALGCEVEMKNRSLIVRESIVSDF
ncbi:MAG: LD-carboxypeptidase [Deltaproteobacteria bacterium]|nr:LD-carboxypeptidase [Deltaproteobacteria bacterium]